MNSDALTLGEGEFNTFWLVATKDRLQLYINGKYVTQFSSLLPDTGSLELAADTGSLSDLTWCTFEDVWDLACDIPALPRPVLAPKSD